MILASSMRHAWRRLAGGIVSRLVDIRLVFRPLCGGKVQVGRDVEGLHNVTFGGNNYVGRGTFFLGPVSVEHASTIGANCCLNGPIRIGRYCQLASAVGIYAQDHPVSLVTTYVNSRLLQGAMRKHTKAAAVCIGHDVWIGHGAIILKGVTIESGAVIGAGAVVTKSVPAYAVVAGNPARILRMRFSDEVIRRLLALQWWFMGPEDLSGIRDLFEIDLENEPAKAMTMLERIQASGPEKHVPGRLEHATK